MVIKPADELVQRQDVRSSGRQLDRQRHPIQSPAQLRKCWRILIRDRKLWPD
jgi:hypothetical protein